MGFSRRYTYDLTSSITGKIYSQCFDSALTNTLSPLVRSVLVMIGAGPCWWKSFWCCMRAFRFSSDSCNFACLKEASRDEIRVPREEGLRKSGIGAEYFVHEDLDPFPITALLAVQGSFLLPVSLCLPTSFISRLRNRVA